MLSRGVLSPPHDGFDISCVPGENDTTGLYSTAFEKLVDSLEARCVAPQMQAMQAQISHLQREVDTLKGSFFNADGKNTLQALSYEIVELKQENELLKNDIKFMKTLLSHVMPPSQLLMSVHSDNNISGSAEIPVTNAVDFSKTWNGYSQAATATGDSNGVNLGKIKKYDESTLKQIVSTNNSNISGNGVQMAAFAENLSNSSGVAASSTLDEWLKSPSNCSSLNDFKTLGTSTDLFLSKENPGFVTLQNFASIATTESGASKSSSPSPESSLTTSPYDDASGSSFLRHLRHCWGLKTPEYPNDLYNPERNHSKSIFDKLIERSEVSSRNALLSNKASALRLNPVAGNESEVCLSSKVGISNAYSLGTHNVESAFKAAANILHSSLKSQQTFERQRLMNLASDDGAHQQELTDFDQLCFYDDEAVFSSVLIDKPCLGLHIPRNTTEGGALGVNAGKVHPRMEYPAGASLFPASMNEQHLSDNITLRVPKSPQYEFSRHPGDVYDSFTSAIPENPCGAFTDSHHQLLPTQVASTVVNTQHSVRARTSVNPEKEDFSFLPILSSDAVVQDKLEHPAGSPSCYIKKENCHINFNSSNFRSKVAASSHSQDQSWSPFGFGVWKGRIAGLSAELLMSPSNRSRPCNSLLSPSGPPEALNGGQIEGSGVISGHDILNRERANSEVSVPISNLILSSSAENKMSPLDAIDGTSHSFRNTLRTSLKNPWKPKQDYVSEHFASTISALEHNPLFHIEWRISNASIIAKMLPVTESIVSPAFETHSQLGDLYLMLVVSSSSSQVDWESRQCDLFFSATTSAQVKYRLSCGEEKKPIKIHSFGDLPWSGFEKFGSFATLINCLDDTICIEVDLLDVKWKDHSGRPRFWSAGDLEMPHVNAV